MDGHVYGRGRGGRGGEMPRSPPSTHRIDKARVTTLGRRTSKTSSQAGQIPDKQQKGDKGTSDLLAKALVSLCMLMLPIQLAKHAD